MTTNHPAIDPSKSPDAEMTKDLEIAAECALAQMRKCAASGSPEACYKDNPYAGYRSAQLDHAHERERELREEIARLRQQIEAKDGVLREVDEYWASDSGQFMSGKWRNIIGRIQSALKGGE